MLISIVIPTKNSAAVLAQCLQSIKEQTCQDYELIIVDAASSDGTRAMSEGFGARFLSHPGSPPAARNLGFSKAKGELFLSIDSDMILEKTLLDDICASMDGNDALIIPEIGHGASFLSRCKDLEKRCYLGDESVEAARVFSKKAFTAVSGYDEDLHFGEDWDLHERIQERFTIGRTTSRVMHDTQRLSLHADLKKSFIYGKSLHRYVKKRKLREGGWLEFLMFRHARTLAKEPVTAAGLVALRLLECTAGLAGYVAASLSKSLDGKG